MSESRTRQLRPPLYYDSEGTARSGERPGKESARRGVGDETGWDAYRKWLASVGKRERPSRTPLDRSVYSWKGYHNWADRVKEQWKSDDS